MITILFWQTDRSLYFHWRHLHDQEFREISKLCAIPFLGHGTYIITRRILNDNQEVTNLYAKLESWLGADRLLVVDEEPDDNLGHINHFKFISPLKIIVGRPDKAGTNVFHYLEKISKLFEKAVMR